MSDIHHASLSHLPRSGPSLSKPNQISTQSQAIMFFSSRSIRRSALVSVGMLLLCWLRSFVRSSGCWMRRTGEMNIKTATDAILSLNATRFVFIKYISIYSLYWCWYTAYRPVYFSVMAQSHSHSLTTPSRARLVFSPLRACRRLDDDCVC